MRKMKHMEDSRTENTYLIMNKHINGYGRLFGGVMKQKIRELEESKNSFFRYEGLKLYLFWGGMVCNILVFLMLASSMFGR